MDLINVPKEFLSQIYIEDGPIEGELAAPCLCGYPTDANDPDIRLIVWYSTGKLMYAHKDCIGKDDA